MSHAQIHRVEARHVVTGYGCIQIRSFFSRVLFMETNTSLCWMLAVFRWNLSRSERSTFPFELVLRRGIFLVPTSRLTGGSGRACCLRRLEDSAPVAAKVVNSQLDTHFSILVLEKNIEET